MICSNCGNKISDASVTCEHCGTPVVVQSAVPPLPAPVLPPPPPGTPSQPAMPPGQPGDPPAAPANPYPPYPAYIPRRLRRTAVTAGVFLVFAMLLIAEVISIFNRDSGLSGMGWNDSILALVSLGGVFLFSLISFISVNVVARGRKKDSLEALIAILAMSILILLIFFALLYVASMIFPVAIDLKQFTRVG